MTSSLCLVHCQGFRAEQPLFLPSTFELGFCHFLTFFPGGRLWKMVLGCCYLGHLLKMSGLISNLLTQSQESAVLTLKFGRACARCPNIRQTAAPHLCSVQACGSRRPVRMWTSAIWDVKDPRRWGLIAVGQSGVRSCRHSWLEGGLLRRWLEGEKLLPTVPSQRVFSAGHVNSWPPSSPGKRGGWQ